MTAVLTASDISVVDARGRNLLEPVSFRLEPGRPLVVLGETGSGKSLLSQAIIGTLPEGLTASGRICLGDAVFSASQPQTFRSLWGRAVALLPQEPWLSLDPLMRVQPQVAETHRLVRGLGGRAATEAAQTDLAALGLAGAQRRYPHQLSGGMAQRAAFAAARAGGARILLADEPTKGLDAARRDEVAGLLLREVAAGGSLLVITHDLALAQRLGTRCSSSATVSWSSGAAPRPSWRHPAATMAGVSWRPTRGAGPRRRQLRQRRRRCSRPGT
ncbi:ATP-binding cassette domain-containing protein [Marinobacterium aestuariivivens]|uniref:ATP-binding cassette domain-containing protein n=1 Tax=Marinobacterium aestuariivivens TaxID=1698799 RepID=A0ABW2A516_9GAMM